MQNKYNSFEDSFGRSTKKTFVGKKTRKNVEFWNEMMPELDMFWAGFL